MTEKEIDGKLDSLLDKDFLDRLVEVAKLYGHRGDVYEIIQFVEDLHYRIEITPPDDIYDVYEAEDWDDYE